MMSSLLSRGGLSVSSVCICMILCVVSQPSSGFGLVGSPSEEKPATADIQQLIETETVKGAVRQQSGHSLGTYSAVAYKSQVVAGTNYFVKVDVGNNQYIHLRVFKPLPYQNAPPSLTGIQLNKSASDPLEYF